MPHNHFLCLAQNRHGRMESTTDSTLLNRYRPH